MEDQSSISPNLTTSHVTRTRVKVARMAGKQITLVLIKVILMNDYSVPERIKRNFRPSTITRNGTHLLL
jgi:hypothetical protein